MTDVHTDPKAEPSDRKAERSIPLWAAVITALGSIVATVITVFGSIAATDREIVPQGGGPTVERTVTVAPTATETVTVDPAGNPAPTGQPTADETALDTNWATDARDYSGEYGKVIVFSCPVAGIPQPVYGTEPVYADESSVCTAAVHADRISLKKGGQITVQIREGMEEYKASRHNGITTEELVAGSSTSFEFLPRR